MNKIVVYPNEVLRKRAEEIKEIDKTLLSEIDDLKKMLEKSENGAALAANQIGVLKRFIGIKDFKEKKVDILINPKIEKFFGEKVYPKIVDEEGKGEDFLEGCLSFPDFYGTVKRYLEIKLSWQDIKGKKMQRILKGFEAIVVQHEYDHLNGVLFVDHVKEEKGKFYKSIDNKMAVWNVDMVIDRK